MTRFVPRPPVALRLVALAVLTGSACSAPESDGGRPTSVRRITVQAQRELTEGSAAVITRAQPGIVFTINDSGHEAELFAVDTTGRARGMWHVVNAENVDWEAAAAGPCANAPFANGTDSAAVSGEQACLTIADVGDNDARRNTRALYRVREPSALAAGDTGTLVAQAVRFRYEDGPHDVEAMVVGPRGDTFLITKRRLAGANGPRPALVFEVPAAAWERDGLTVARLVDSLPIVPGTSTGRSITDASLSPDGRYVAVRTYNEVYIFFADTATGRPRSDRPVAQCNIWSIERDYGEGITWIGTQGEVLLTQEGRNSPFYAVTCPLPHR